MKIESFVSTANHDTGIANLQTKERSQILCFLVAFVHRRLWDYFIRWKHFDCALFFWFNLSFCGEEVLKVVWGLISKIFVRKTSWIFHNNIKFLPFLNFLAKSVGWKRRASNSTRFLIKYWASALNSLLICSYSCFLFHLRRCLINETCKNLCQPDGKQPSLYSQKCIVHRSDVLRMKTIKSFLQASLGIAVMWGEVVKWGLGVNDKVEMNLKIIFQSFLEYFFDFLLIISPQPP